MYNTIMNRPTIVIPNVIYPNYFVNNYKEPIKHKVKKSNQQPPKNFWDKFQSILNIILN